MMKDYYIYKIICLMDDWNGKFYIGKRYGKMDDNYTGSGKLITQYFKEYDKIKGLTYDKQILEVGDENSICDLEREYIREGMKSELCLNLYCASGKGHFGQKHSEETKQKMSEALKGQNNPMYGNHKQLSSEHKKKLSEAHKGMKHSEETKHKMSISRKGKQLSDETKHKLSEAAKRRWARN